jgi:N-acetylneuraminic acid mutarotase
VYVIGGADAATSTVLSTVDAFDTTTGTWSTKTPMPTPRYLGAAAVVNNRICVVGGVNLLAGPSGTLALDTMECYDPVTDSWSSGPGLPTGRQGLGFDAVGSFAYAVGGVRYFGPPVPNLTTVERYDAATNSWSTVAALPTARANLAVVGAGGLLFAIGGYGTSVPIPTVEAYDPSLAAWKAKTPVPSLVSYARAVQVGGVIYVFDQEGHTWQYTPANDIL